MTLQVDTMTTKKLFLVKRLYQHAEVLSYTSRNPVNCIMAVIGFDLAVETVLKVVVSALETKNPPEKNYDGLIQQTNDKLSKAGFLQVPNESTIRRVHELRNNAQHKAIYPSEPEVSDCRTYTRDFIDKLVFQLWGISFESINLVGLVQHRQVKQLLEKAQNALGQKDYIETIANTNAGLNLTMILARRKLFPDLYFRLREPLDEKLERFENEVVITESIDAKTWRALDQLNKGIQKRLSTIKKGIMSLRNEVKDEIESLEKLQMYTILGMNYVELLQFNKIAGRISFMSLDEDKEIKFYIHDAKKDPSEDEANFVFSYSLETVLKIEESLYP